MGRYSDLINYVVIGGIALAVAVFLIRRLRRRRRARDPVAGEPAGR